MATEPPTPAVTDRELQVLYGMSHGKTNAQIGRVLGLSEDTIKTHAMRLFRRIGAHDRAHAVRLGFETGLLTTSGRVSTATSPNPEAVPDTPIPTGWLIPPTQPRPYSDRHIAACFAAQGCPCRAGATWQWPDRQQVAS